MFSPGGKKSATEASFLTIDVEKLCQQTTVVAAKAEQALLIFSFLITDKV